MISGEFIFDHNRYKVDTITIMLTHTRAASVTDLNYRDHDGYLALKFFCSNSMSIALMHIQSLKHFLWQVDANYLLCIVPLLCGMPFHILHGMALLPFITLLPKRFSTIVSAAHYEIFIKVEISQ